MEIFEPFLDLNNLKFVGKSNGMHEFSSKQLFIIVSYFVYEMYHCGLCHRLKNCHSQLMGFWRQNQFAWALKLRGLRITLNQMAGYGASSQVSGLLHGLL